MATLSFLRGGLPSPSNVCPEYNKVYPSASQTSCPNYLVSCIPATATFNLLNSFTKKPNFLLTKCGPVDSRCLVLGWSHLYSQSISFATWNICTRVLVMTAESVGLDLIPDNKLNPLVILMQNTTHLTLSRKLEANKLL